MPQTVPSPTLHIAFELSNKTWKIGFQYNARRRFRSVSARDLVALAEEITNAKEKLQVCPKARVVSCYEAGRDGFWLHRALESLKVENHVINPASIRVDRRARRAKTDQLDLKSLLTMLVRYAHGDEDDWSPVRVPTAEVEDRRRTHRERDRLVKERTGHSNRLRSLLVAQGVDLVVSRDFLERLDAVRLWDGSEMPPRLRRELSREFERWKLADEQIKAIEADQRRALRENRRAEDSDAHDAMLAKANQLADLCGIGVTGAWVLAHEFYWRDFNNRREVGAALGLTGTPYDSGDAKREQGISKAGSPRLRALLIELSWAWLRFQPDSRITAWFNDRFGEGRRLRRIGIVAVARRLAVALWRFLKDGIVPDGAVWGRSAAVVI